MRIILFIVGLGFLFPSGLFLFFAIEGVIKTRALSMNDFIVLWLVLVPFLFGIYLCRKSLSRRDEDRLTFKDIGYLFFSLKGRGGRRAYWLAYLALLLVLFVVGFFIDGNTTVAEQGPSLFAILLVIYPWAAVQVKRWHDIDKSGWWIYINAIPIIGTAYALISNGFLKGTVGANRFGDKP